MGYLNIVVFLGYIVYNYLSGSVLTPKNPWYFIIAIIMGVLSIALLAYSNYDRSNEVMNWKIFIIFLILLGIGYGSNIYGISKLENASQTKIEHYQNRILFSTSFFLFCGLIAYGLNFYESDRCNNSEFLCNTDMMIILLIGYISIYQLVHSFRFSDNKTFFISDEDTDTSKTGILNISILCLWQFYIYFLLDGFTGGTIKTKISEMHGSGNRQTMYEIFSGLSLIVIVGFLLNNILLTNETKKCKNENINKGYVDDIKEVSYNMIITTFVVMFIILFFK